MQLNLNPLMSAPIMTETAKNVRALMEEMYTSRMTELVELESFGDAHSLFEEFVVDSEEPDKHDREN